MRTYILIAGLLTALLVMSLGPALATEPELPRTYVDTTSVPSGGQTIAVGAGGDFQAALDAAQPGDVITLEAGATFIGPFTLPNKAGSDWIIVRTSAPDSSLPPPGTRITPDYSSVMPKVTSPDYQPALKTAPGAHHFRFVGVEFTVLPSVTLNYFLVRLGDGSGSQNSPSQVPHHLILDRCYVHGHSRLQINVGVTLDTAQTAVIDSYVSEIHAVGQDSQALSGTNGPGPFKIVNNYLEGAGENLMFGGADPAIPDLVPSDIEVRGNHFFKLLSWRPGDPSYAGTHWSVKNLFELKNARRVLIEGNVFEHNWLDGQNGYAILFTVRNQSSTAPWSVVEDVTFANNVVRHTGSGILILGRDNTWPSGSRQTARILIKNNVFDDVSGGRWGGQGELFQLLVGAADVVIEHNTAFQDGSVLVAEGAPDTGFVYRNNLTPHNAYGVIGTDYGVGNSTLTRYFPDVVFLRNVLAGGTASLYPTDNFFPVSLDDVGFVDRAGGDYRLAAFSPYKNAGTDGLDVGADVDALDAATAGVISGSPPNLSVNPQTTVDFGSVMVGQSADRSYTVTNTGGSALTGTVSTAAPFGIVSGGSVGLGAGLSQTVVVRFSPTATGTFAGNVTFTSNGGNGSGILTGTGTAASNPVPVVSGLSPSSATAGSASFTLTVTGTNFVGASGVQVNGAGRTTTYASATQLTATVLASDIATAGTAQVTVVTPAPGGRTSNAVPLTVSAPPPPPAVSASGTVLVGGMTPVVDSVTDSVPPAVSVAVWSLGDEFQIDAYASDDKALSELAVYVNGYVVGTTTCSGSTCTVSATLNWGFLHLEANFVTAVAMDASGNEGVSAPYVIYR